MKIHRIKVLLIDDDEDDYIIVRDLLAELSLCSKSSSDKFILEWISDYRAALDAILSREFDVCLLDYRLKERNGLEFMREAVNRGTMTPVVFLTAQRDHDLELEAMNKGAADWLPKSELSATFIERSIRHVIQRQRKRDDLIKAKKVIQALSECNHAVIHMEDEVELLRAICRIVVDVGGYRMAWVGYAGEDRNQTVTPVASYGYESGYLETVNITWQDAERGKGPIGTCIRTGLHSIIRCVGAQAEFAPWREEASRRGYASAIGLPLFLDGRRLGALGIYSSQMDAFDTDEVEFLLKLSGNLSHGIEVLRLRKAQIQAEESLKEAKLDLERRVEKRTAELAKVNVELRTEVEERKQAEEAFKESRQQLANIIDFLPDATLVVDNEGKVIAWNRAIEEMTGVKAIDMLGKGDYEYALPFYGERRPILIDLVIRPDEEIMAKYPSRARRATGIEAEGYLPGLRTGRTYLYATASVLRDSIGNIVGAVESIRDISERKLTEEEKEKLEAHLRHSQKLEAVGMLAGGIAHDFNNILQPVIGYTEMALNELPRSNPIRDDLEQVLNGSLRARELIRQILAVSSSTQEQQRIPIDISSIVKEALKFLRSSLPTSIEIRQNIQVGVVLADSTQIHQVLMNLCTNAALAMGDEGVLEVGLSPVDLSKSDLADQSIVGLEPGPYVKLCVSDTGVGMDEETMERIFDPYFTTREVGKGSGLGLAVVNGIAKRHNGTITVRSEPGKGTTFSVYFPRIETATLIPAVTLEEAAIGAESIFFLDDEPAVVKMGTAILERLGYKITSETDSLRALEVFGAGPDEFDLIITDYTMPNLTGMDFAREVRRIRPDLPILLCTGFSEKITHESVEELRLVLLKKPCRLRELSEVVRKTLDARKETELPRQLHRANLHKAEPEMSC